MAWRLESVHTAELGSTRLSGQLSGYTCPGSLSSPGTWRGEVGVRWVFTQCTGHREVGVRWVFTQCTGHREVGVRWVFTQCTGHREVGVRWVFTQCTGHREVGVRWVFTQCTGHREVGYDFTLHLRSVFVESGHLGRIFF